MNELEEIRTRIHYIRGKQVMLDKDLAELYGVEVKRLNESVKRNIERFPDDFMFQLNKDEYEFLRSQFATIKSGRGEHVKYLPYAFTEQGVAMLSGVLRSPIAIEVNIRIMRAFVAIRRYLASPNCGNCQLESEVKRLSAYIEEVLADANDRDEMMEQKIDRLENAMDMLQNDVAMLQASLSTEEQESKEKRIFSMTVKGFTKE